MWWWLFACAPTTEAPTPAAVAPAAVEPVVWRLTGRASSAGLETPALPSGGALLGERCAAANERLAGDGPPCFVEEWTGDRTIRVERAGRALRFDGVAGRTRWSQLDGPFAACLGDPLAIPPAGDPGGTRALDDRRWVIVLSGANRCGIAGRIVLDATRNRAEWADLTVRGAPWAAGGREAALVTVRAEVRALVRDRWAELSAAEQADALRALADDPDPEARALIARRR